jgi:asparagine synthase (glutamine-hydrolysing)
MCGIAGTFNTSTITTSRVHEAISAIRHRGPDETGFHLNSVCSLGIARLAIIDVERGQQPSFNESQDVLSVFNGEIYNYKELVEMLAGKGHRLSNNSDSEIIPHLYEEFGEYLVDKIEGMFAIAIWDKVQKKLVLIRDRLGKKPLWYALEGKGVSFCSEIKGLLSLGLKSDFDESSLTEYLTFGYVNSPRSPYKGISQLEPATVMTFTEAGQTQRRYWDPSDAQSRDISWSEARERANDLIRNAVSRRLVSERPLGIFLSGGIDSSLVTAFATQMLDKVETFTIGFDESEFDESSHAREVSNYLGTTHNQLIIRPNPELLITKIAQSLDVPFADSSIVPTFLLSEFTRQKVVVALSGDGGDEVFGGYDRYRVNHYLSKINWALRSNVFPALVSKNSEENRTLKLLRAIAHQSSKDRYLGMQTLISESGLKALTDVNQRNQSPYDLVSDFWKDKSSVVTAMQLFDLLTYLPGDLLYKADMASMAHGLEVRSPFLDFRLVEFGLSLPTDLKINLRENKLLLRSVLENFLPKFMCHRAKKGFSIPRAEWLRNELKPMVYDLLLNPNSFVSNYVETPAITGLIDEHMTGKDRDATIWSLLMLELWAKNWLQQE